MAETKGDKTVLRSPGLGGHFGGGTEGMMDVKDGKILRVRPFNFDCKYDREKIRTWKMGKNGKTLFLAVFCGSPARFAV
jgi:trimethylamine-N-oxide reductase (cytochrome c)